MRDAFHNDVKTLTERVGGLATVVADAMEAATQSLLDADLALSERVIANDDEIDAMRSQCEEKAYTLLALQAPVAGDMRTIVAFIHAAEKL